MTNPQDHYDHYDHHAQVLASVLDEIVAALAHPEISPGVRMHLEAARALLEGDGDT